VSASANINELRVFFRFHGDIVDIRDLSTTGGELPCTYLVEYKEPKEAESALLFDRTSFYSSPIRVELSTETIAEWDREHGRDNEDFEEFEDLDNPPEEPAFAPQASKSPGPTPDTGTTRQQERSSSPVRNDSRAFAANLDAKTPTVGKSEAMPATPAREVTDSTEALRSVEKFNPFQPLPAAMVIMSYFLYLFVTSFI